jgi:thermostable 8-oxoguanine DNA glycosylase
LILIIRPVSSHGILKATLQPLRNTSANTSAVVGFGRQQNLATRFVNLSAQLIQPKIYETGHLFTNQKQNITSQNYHK